MRLAYAYVYAVQHAGVLFTHAVWTINYEAKPIWKRSNNGCCCIKHGRAGLPINPSDVFVHNALRT